jgi:hypothetical protein
MAQYKVKRDIFVTLKGKKIKKDEIIRIDDSDEKEVRFYERRATDGDVELFVEEPVKANKKDKE